MHKPQMSFSKVMKKNNISKEQKMLVALSGGADSVCATILSHSYFDEIIAVHINYGLRGEESNSEQKYVEKLCFDLGVKLYTKTVSAKEKTGGNQSRYRDLRYDFFSDIYTKECCDYLIVGHHKNDQAETVLMNMLKGAGVVGLSGIKTLSENFGMKILRPLLDITKNEIISFLNAKQVGFKTDSSNIKNDYTRNKIRNQIIPGIENSLQVNAVESLSKLSHQMSDVMNMFETFNAQIRSAYIERTNNFFSMKLGAMQNDYHHAIVKHFIYSFLTKELMIKPVQSVHVDDVIELFSLENGSQLHLPDNNMVIKQKDRLIFNKNIVETPLSFNYDLCIGEEIFIEEIGYKIMALHGFIEEEVRDLKPIHLLIAEDCNHITITSYEEGSKIAYKDDGHKKIKKLMKEKSTIPLSKTWYIKYKDKPIYIPDIEYIAHNTIATQKVTLYLKPLY